MNDPDEYARTAVDKELAEHGFPDGRDDLRRLISAAAKDAQADLYERLLRSEALNAELARMLHRWVQETDDAGHYCCGVQCDDGTEHSANCLAGQSLSLLKKARTE